VRRAAREKGLAVVELPGRGKGPHQIYDVVDAEGKARGRFGLTSRPREPSWIVLRNLEEGLAHLFGDQDVTEQLHRLAALEDELHTVSADRDAVNLSHQRVNQLLNQ